jgi:hypothetical protein
VGPDATYGCQVWLPETLLVRNFQRLTSHGSVLNDIARDPLEKLHLAFLKWNLGVGRKTSNAAVWGDTDRYPLAIEACEQVFG